MVGRRTGPTRRSTRVRPVCPGVWPDSPRSDGSRLNSARDGIRCPSRSDAARGGRCQQLALIKSSASSIGGRRRDPTDGCLLQPRAAHHRQCRADGTNRIAVVPKLQRRHQTGGDALVPAQRRSTVQAVGKRLQPAGRQRPQRINTVRARAGPVPMTQHARRPQPHAAL